MSHRSTEELILDEYSPEEYAAMFGCDPCYDRAPRIPGDGYLFYNFGSEKQERTNDCLDSFVGAIDRTIASCDKKDIEGLEQLKNYVITQKVN